MEPTNNQEKEIEILKGYLEDYLKNFTSYYNPSRKYGNKFLCIAHEETRPSMSLDPHNKKYIKCFSCNARFSLIDLVIKDYDIGDQSQPLEARLKNSENIKEACNKIKELFNLNGSATIPTAKNYQPEPYKKEDLQAIYNMGLYGNPAKDYLKSRALTDNELNQTLGLRNYYKNNMGFLTIPYQLKGELETLTERVISLTGKDIKDLPKELRYKHHGKMQTYDPFNYLDARTERAIFITEGEIDTISFYTVLKELKKEGSLILPTGAIALGGINNNRDLIKRLDNLPAKDQLYFILALDNDQRGALAQKNLIQVMEEHEIAYTTFNYKAFKDANEYLQANKEAFKGSVKETITSIKELCKKASEDYLEGIEKEIAKEKEEYINKNSALGYINIFNENRLNPVKACKSYFSALDNLLNGGFRAGLITIGAVSSLGKTSFILQLADQIAQSRQKDILYFSLEMSQEELIAKSLNRLSYLLCNNKTQNIKSQTEITSSNFNNWNQDQKDLYNEAIESYKSFGDHIFIKEGVGSYGVKEIEQALKEHIEKTNKTPLIFIDYLQILNTPDPHLTDKQKTDTNILALKQLSRDYKTPIILVSSLNRASYSQEVNLASFKESGAIEYTSDIILGLNYNLTDAELEELRGLRKTLNNLPDAEKEKKIEDFYKKVRANSPRNIKLTILKNRAGEKDKDILYYFYPKFNFFKEQEQSMEIFKELLEHSRTKSQKEFIPLPF